MSDIKTFKTIDELIDILKQRNVSISDEEDAKKYLLGHSYYAVVNGYKDPFLDRSKSQHLGHDYYQNGTDFIFFEVMYAMDSMLRDYTRSILVEAETVMKNATVYAFCYYNREVESYLDPASYCLKWDYHIQERYTSNLIKLLSTLEKNRNNSQSKGYIKHYLKRHKYVPLWVLENALTFGNMSAFFDLQKTKVQNAACRNVEKISGLKKYSLGIKGMREAYRTLSSYRNICSHEERLYCARVGRNKYSFGDMFRYLQKILPDQRIKSFAQMIRISTQILDRFPQIKKLVFEAMDIEENDIVKLGKESELYKSMQERS